jgi:hypothetical protein
MRTTRNPRSSDALRLFKPGARAGIGTYFGVHAERAVDYHGHMIVLIGQKGSCEGKADEREKECFQQEA